MNLRVPADARPQVRTLLAVTLLSVALWFIPFAGYLTYPFKLFVTFIHEGGHALAAWLTWNSVLSLSVAPDTSGLTITTQGGFFSQLLVSSAGYVGSMAYGALLLVLIRKAMAARYVLFGSAGLVLVLTLFFGLLLPIGHIATDFWASVPFTLVSGLVIAGALIAVGMWTSPRVASFFASFLAAQCVLNALLDLKTVFFMSTPFSTYAHSDAVNLANLTGLPRIVWAGVWVVVSLLILSAALRVYAVKVESGLEN